MFHTATTTTTTSTTTTSQDGRKSYASFGYKQDQDVSAEVAKVYGAQKEVAFVHMKDGSEEDYEFMGLWYDLDLQKNMVNRVLNLLQPLKGVKNGGKIDLYDHSLQVTSPHTTPSLPHNTYSFSLFSVCNKSTEGRR